MNEDLGWQEFLQIVTYLNSPSSAKYYGVVCGKIAHTVLHLLSVGIAPEPIFISPKFPHSPRFPRAKWNEYACYDVCKIYY